MNFFTYAIVLTALLLACLASTVLHAEENSTYNFYFQKAPGPVTVNQGGSATQPVPAPVPVAPAPPAPAGTTVNIVPATEAPSTNKKFFLSLGYAIPNSFNEANKLEIVTGQKDQYFGNQFAIKGEYDLNDRLSLSGEIYKLKDQVNIGHYRYDKSDSRLVSPVSSTEEDSLGRAPPAKNVLDFGLGVAAHVVRLNSTTFSFIGGAVTVPRIHFSEISRNGTVGVAEAKDGVTHAKTFFTGARLRLIADNVWGLDISYRALLGIDKGITQLALTFKL